MMTWLNGDDRTAVMSGDEVVVSLMIKGMMTGCSDKYNDGE